ncbi:MAG TPA: carbamoyltransferase HypF, partial [Candidatus Hydrogenedentes bacterium]|nr:carbamoyltransferase HypF [Candidatus Hydrogenedentota bacterium]
GLGGFHLACDAGSETAVAALRERKERAEKPFAIMAPDLEAARELVILSIEEERLLSSAARPIVLARKKAGHGLAESVAPKSPDFGVMLPYTPLHHLLMDEPCKALVMTSGNVTDEPIAHENDEALSRLAGIADGFLLHDRDIHIRADDSVMRTIAGKPAFLRRSRGYAPFPVRLPFGTEGSEVLAVGPELKDTVCVTRNGYAFVSHHIGDLMNAAAYRAFRQAADHLCNILEVTPTCVACDMHPDYLSTRYAEERGVPIARIQHHHAHAASVLAEHGRTDGVIGVSFDGLGWGEHHEVWGGEFLVCDLSDFERAGRIESMPLAGGDAATKRPERMAYAYLRAAFGDDAEALAKRLVPSLSDHTRAFLSDIMQQGVNCPLTSSVGRLFDAASALLGVCTVNTFEGQAAIELDGVAAAAADDEQCYHTRIETDSSGAFIAHTTDIIKGLVEDILNGTSTAACAARFHGSVARMAAETCVQIREKTGVSAAALSGGVFANALLTARLKKLLEAQAFEVLLNRMVPAGDGGVSLGQAAVAAWRLQCA